MAQSPLITVGVWQKKSLEAYVKSKDRLIFVVNKGFDAMAALLSKDPDEVRCALTYLNVERTLALQFDKIKDDPLRDLVYGLLESLHGSLNEWNEERNQRKGMYEISTQTKENPLLPLLEPPLLEVCPPIDNNASNDLSTIPNPPPSFPIELKEEPIDSHQSLPHDYQISASELMRDEMMFKEEEMENENTELVTPHSNPIFNDSLDLIDQGLNFTRSLPLNSVVDPIDIPPRDNQMPPLNTLRDEVDFKEEEMANDDVIVPRDSMGEEMNLDDVENTGMGDVVNDSLNEQPFEDNDSLRTIQPSDVMDYLMNFNYEILGDRDPPLTEMNSLNEVSMSFEDVVETDEPEIDGEKRGLSANDLTDNEGEESEGVDDPTYTPKTIGDRNLSLTKRNSLNGGSKDLINKGGELNGAVDDPTDTPRENSDTIQAKKRRRSSRQASRPMQYNDPVEDSDGDVSPSVKKSKSESLREKDDKRRSFKGEEKSKPARKKSPVSKKNDTELECPECEFRTLSVISWVSHLRLKHSTNPALAGLALLCGCGKETLTEMHIRTCTHGNITVIRKRDGPIRRLDDEKTTPQCVLCEMYPKTACGYVFHLHDHHKSTLMKSGVYLKCSCGHEIRSSNNHNHREKASCNPRQFTLHKLND